MTTNIEKKKDENIRLNNKEQNRIHHIQQYIPILIPTPLPQDQKERD
jgi:uncharacterized protein YbaR (Trm112 family)